MINAYLQKERSLRTLRILHLEHDAAIAEQVRSTLEEENIDCLIHRVSSKAQFKAALQADAYDFILSDLSIPGFDGFGALAMANERHPDVPFLLLSESGDGRITPSKCSTLDANLKSRLQRLSSTVLRAHHEASERRERQRTEEENHQQAELLNHATDAIFVRNLEQKIIYWNKGAERIYGWSSAEAIGKLASDLLYKRTAPPRDSIWKTVLDKGEWMGEIEQATKSGQPIFVTNRRTLLRDSSGAAEAVLNINTDITEKRGLEAQLQRSQRMDSVGALAGGIAHDLNNVLAPILMATELLRDQLHQTEDIAMLDIARGSAQRGIDLVKQILQFSQGTKGQGTLKVKAVFDDLVNLITKTFPRTLAIKADVSPDLMAVSCDPTQLHQIAINLCINARDAMPEGGKLEIGVSNRVLVERQIHGQVEPVSGSYVELTVSDTGTGMSPEILGRMFEPFFTTKEEGRGTGLGLSTIATILRNIQGFLEVSTLLGEGTTFRVFLPVLEQIHLGEHLAKATSFGSGELILLVDDELALLEMTKELLEAHKYTVATAINGMEALNFFSANRDKVALVVTDMLMPGLAGDELIRKIREISPETLTICLSGSPDRSGLRCNQTGANAFLQKPCSTQDLIIAIQNLLNSPRNLVQLQPTRG